MIWYNIQHVHIRDKSIKTWHGTRNILTWTHFSVASTRPFPYMKQPPFVLLMVQLLSTWKKCPSLFLKANKQTWSLWYATSFLCYYNSRRNSFSGGKQKDSKNIGRELLVHCMNFTTIHSAVKDEERVPPPQRPSLFLLPSGESMALS